MVKGSAWLRRREAERADLKTLREIITAAYHKTGGKGEPPASYIRDWREQHKGTYGKWSLGTLFKSGSSHPCSPPARLRELVSDEQEDETAPTENLRRQLEHAEWVLGWARRSDEFGQHHAQYIPPHLRPQVIEGWQGTVDRLRALLAARQAV